jgi:hypothetical protein
VKQDLQEQQDHRVLKELLVIKVLQELKETLVTKELLEIKVLKVN